MEALDAIKNRRSVRKYTEQAVPKEMLQTVLDAANWAPSNGNSQPWEFIILGADPAQQVSGVFHAWAKDYIPQAAYIPQDKKTLMLDYAKNFGGAPYQIVVTYPVDDDAVKTEEALMAASAAIQNLCLAAHAIGLGTVWIAGHTAHAEATRHILNLTSERKIAGIIPIGFPAVQPPAPPRKDPQLQYKVRWVGC